VKKKNCCQRSAIFVTVAVTIGNSLCGVERVKRFVNIRLPYVTSNLKRINKMATFPPSGKISADPHVDQYEDYGPIDAMLLQHNEAKYAAETQGVHIQTKSV